MRFIWLNTFPWEIPTRKAATAMVAAFSVQARLVSPHSPPAHPKSTERTLVSLFLRLILVIPTSVKLILKWCSETLLVFPSWLCYFFLFQDLSLISGLKWTVPTVFSHFLINSNRHRNILTDRLSCWGQPLLSHGLRRSSLYRKENARLPVEQSFKAELPEDRVLWGGKWNIACLCLCAAAVFYDVLT